MRKTLEFGKIDYNGTGRKINRVSVDIELKDKKEGPALSICGDIWNSKGTDIVCGGQCLDTISRYIKTDFFKKILRLWKMYHLNDMHAGTVEQEAYLDGLKADGWKYDYNDACAKLRDAGLYEVDGYKYGHAWLYREIPEEDIAAIREIIG